jgi:predicted AlkP superfamily pyrophosphatase or phosphodiesterase
MVPSSEPRHVTERSGKSIVSRIMQQVAVINIVALTDSLIGEWSPNLRTFRGAGYLRTLEPVLPAVTTTVQSSMLTGELPRVHGIVGNGWYNREYSEIHFWKQSNKLVQGEKVWETATSRAIGSSPSAIGQEGIADGRPPTADRSFTCANMFWWYNMYSSVDCSVTPRPMYKADGRKIPDCYSHPPELRDELQEQLGRFPLFHFWGPMASIKSSKWIAEASMRVHEQYDPTLMLIYLPHLDYGLQKFGPDDPRVRKDVTEIDRVAGELIDFFRQRDVQIIITSEYGIEPVSDAVHLNRILRDEGSLRVRVEEGLELLDAGASDCFVVADHQIAHAYVRDPKEIGRYKNLLGSVHGVDRALDRAEQAEFGIDHERAGDLVLIAERGRWFSYYYWLNDDRAPDFARCVDIHRKPGYDPVELFLDPAIKAPKLKLAMKLARKNMGFRTLMDVIPLDAKLVRGSHGRIDLPPERGPLLITERDLPGRADRLSCTDVRDVILGLIFDRNDPSP